jgi:hypothetical protein
MIYDYSGDTNINLWELDVTGTTVTTMSNTTCEACISGTSWNSTDDSTSACMLLNNLQQNAGGFCACGGRVQNAQYTGTTCTAPAEIMGTPANNGTFIWQPGPI